MRSQRALVIGLAAVVLVAGLGGYGGYRVWRHLRAAAPAPAPRTAVVVQAPTPTPVPVPAAPTPTPAPTPLPPSVFMKVPYTSQFPTGVFSGPYEEYCEAAALLMVGQYFRGDTRDRIPAGEANASMGAIVGTERRDFPGMLDLPLTNIGAVGTQMFSLKPTIAPADPNVIERNLAQGRPVIIPVMTHGANGQKISPHYNEGNVYHVIVLTGYDVPKGVFYANDAGFIQGQNWAYQWSTLSAAIDAQAAKQGRVMLVFDRQ
jgi:hypothetical protein